MDETLLSLLEQDTRVSFFVRLIQQDDVLIERLNWDESFLLYAPSNTAMYTLSESVREALTHNTDFRHLFFDHHIVTPESEWSMLSTHDVLVQGIYMASNGNTALRTACTLPFFWWLLW